MPVRIALLILTTLLAGSATADILDEIGYSRLRQELGDKTPDGSGIEVVQVEAANTNEAGELAYAPEPGNDEFLGKTIIDATGTGKAPSGHATSVGKIFYGRVTSPAKGIRRIESYLAGDWYVDGFLLPQPVIGQLPPQPAMTSARIGNHSFVGSFGEANGMLLRRLDWVIETDEFIQVVGFNGGGRTPIAASAFNAISVDQTSAARAVGSAYVDKLYAAQRTRPDLVVPETNPSSATPWVSAAVALLIEAAHDNRKLSNDPVQASTRNRSGKEIYNAERSEVIKAALMAGAVRETNNAKNGNINLYRGSGTDRTKNGLDRRYGAGQLNIYNSYRIIAAGEQNSREDRRIGRGRIGETGFDYDPEFGCASDCNAEATYYFSTGKETPRLTAALVWNIDIDGGIESIFVAAATLHDLNLTLYDVSKSRKWKKVASSDSATENTEHLWVALQANTEYALKVTGVRPFRQDFALAWRLTSD